MDGLVQDLRYAFRRLRKKPGFTAVAVLTLALGIGANTTMFSVVSAVLLQPLAMQDPSRVIFVREHWRDMLGGLSVGNFADAQRESNSFTSLGASGSASFNLATRDAPQRVEGEIATASYFSTFGVPPIAGRLFTPDEDRPGHGQVAVISERLWRSHFHGDVAFVGHTIQLNGLPYTVVGVMPK